MNEGMGSTSKLLVQASFAGTSASTMISPLSYLLVDKFGGGVFDVGLGYRILSVTTGAVVYSIGRCPWFERNARRMVFLGFLAAGLGDLSYFLIRNTAEFFAVQILMGLSLGVLDPAWDALYSDEEDGRSSARKWSAWTGGSEMAAGLAALLGAALLKFWGFAPLFGGMALLNGVAVYLSFRIMRSDQDGGKVRIPFPHGVPGALNTADDGRHAPAGALIKAMATDAPRCPPVAR